MKYLNSENAQGDDDKNPQQKKLFNAPFCRFF